jgi:hypothetical protein
MIVLILQVDVSRKLRDSTAKGPQVVQPCLNDVLHLYLGYRVLILPGSEGYVCRYKGVRVGTGYWLGPTYLTLLYKHGTYVPKVYFVSDHWRFALNNMRLGTQVCVDSGHLPGITGSKSGELRFLVGTSMVKGDVEHEKESSEWNGSTTARYVSY